MARSSPASAGRRRSPLPALLLLLPLVVLYLPGLSRAYPVYSYDDNTCNEGTSNPPSTYQKIFTCLLLGTIEDAAVPAVTEFKTSSDVLSGTLPISLSDPPTAADTPNLSQMTSLVNLDLYGASLISGKLPDIDGFWANLQQLTSINLAHTLMSGTVPSYLHRLTGLRELNLVGTKINGTIPATVGQLTSMEILFLRNLDLIGTIPDAMGRLSNLRELQISNTHLSGSLPEALWNSSLRSMIAYNTLMDEAPCSPRTLFPCFAFRTRLGTDNRVYAADLTKVGFKYPYTADTWRPQGWGPMSGRGLDWPGPYNATGGWPQV